MLRRMKAQVKIFLPKKTDEVVLCRITPLQVDSTLQLHLATPPKSISNQLPKSTSVSKIVSTAPIVS
jgi:hypothetical protein